MFIKKLLASLLALSLLLAAGCAPTPSAPPVEEAPEKSEAPSFLGIMLGDAFLEEWVAEDTTCRINWQKLRLSEDGASAYPALSKAFEKLNLDADTDSKALMYEMVSTAQDLRAESDDTIALQSDAEIFIQRADSLLVSWLEATSIYMGGVHPDYYCLGGNYDPSTGNAVPLSDVVTDPSKLPETLCGLLIEKYPDMAFNEETLLEIFTSYAQEDYQWTVDYQGVTFWFSPYEIAAFAAGTLSAKLYFADHAELFTEKYVQPEPACYAITLPMWHELEFDLSAADDVRDRVCASTTPDQTGSYSMLRLDVNQAWYTDEINYAYAFDNYLVHMGDKNYIYSNYFSDGGFNLLTVVDVNQSTLTQTFSEYAALRAEVEEGDAAGIAYREVLNDPQSFVLVKTIELLGTRDMYAAYRTGADGTPQSVQDEYILETPHTVTSTVPLEAQILPQMEWRTLPTGTEMLPVRTDGESYVIVKFGEEEARLNIDISAWPKKINGIPDEECFENILYAG